MSSPNPPPLPPRNPTSGTSAAKRGPSKQLMMILRITILVFLAVIFGPRLVSAIFSGPDKKLASAALVKAQAIYAACEQYAQKHQGLPAGLEALVPEFLPDRSALLDPVAEKAGMSQLFAYNRLEPNSGPTNVMIESMRTKFGRRAVIFADGAAHVIEDRSTVRIR